MTIRKFLLVLFCTLLAFSCLPDPSRAAGQPVNEFLAAIYKTYESGDIRGIGVDSPRFATLVTPRLLRMIKTDARRAARRRQVPTLDGDPFVDAQDWKISALKFDITEEDAKATARVAFKNAGQARTVTLLLVKAKDGGWRIDDFVGAEGSLRKILGGK